MTMQRRHFELIAEVLLDQRPGERDERWEGWADTCTAFARKLRATNPNFNEARFLRACGVTDA